MAAVAFPLTRGQVLRSSSTQYTIVDFLGEGCYSYVAKCLVNFTSELVAVKILKHKYVKNVENELSMLKRISELNPENCNVVKFYEKFEYSSYTCLVFELLEMDLNQYFTTELHSPLCVNKIRSIAKQMLVALQGLKSLQIMHTDIKTNNIMLANIEDDAIEVKLIDFGLARPSSYAMCGKVVQPIGKRAPEVYLGLPYTEAIDMWGLGCTLAEVYLKAPLFPRNCEYLMMKSMVKYLGMPSDHQLRLGMYAENFFLEEEDELGCSWRLLTPKEFSDYNEIKVKEWPRWCPNFHSLDELVHVFKDDEELKDRLEFIDFLKHLLTLDAGERFSPAEALQHPFITMTHLSQDPDGGDYLTKAEEFMATKASLRGHSVTDDETHVAEQRYDEVPVTPASSQIRHVETDVTKVPLPDVTDDNECIQEPCHSTQEDSRVRSLPFPKRLRSFFSRIKTAFCGCWRPSVQE